MFGTIDFLRHNFSLNLLSDIVLIIVLHTEANNIAVDVFFVLTLVLMLLLMVMLRLMLANIWKPIVENERRAYPEHSRRQFYPISCTVAIGRNHF